MDTIAQPDVGNIFVHNWIKLCYSVMIDLCWIRLILYILFAGNDFDLQWKISNVSPDLVFMLALIKAIKLTLEGRFKLFYLYATIITYKTLHTNKLVYDISQNTQINHKKLKRLKINKYWLVKLKSDWKKISFECSKWLTVISLIWETFACFWVSIGESFQIHTCSFTW